MEMMNAFSVPDHFFAPSAEGEDETCGFFSAPLLPSGGKSQRTV